MGDVLQKGLEDPGIKVLAFSKVEKKYQSEISPLITEASEQATTSFNAKVEIWNAWAEQNSEETLARR